MKFVANPLTTLRIYSNKYSGLDTAAAQKMLWDNLDKYHTFDEVWLSTLDGNCSIAEHKDFIEKLRPLAEGLRERNILVSLQLSSCIGHFVAPQYENGFPWTKDDLMTGIDGAVVDGKCCPSSKSFTEWTGKVFAMYCRELGIHAAYIDDDVRLVGHGAVTEGCFCRRCLEGFSAVTGKKWTREELAAALDSKETTHVRTQWMEFHTKTIAEFCGAVAASVYAESPATIMGIQNVNCVVAHDCWNWTPVFKAMAEASRKPARVRIGAAAWSDFVPQYIVDKAVFDGCDADDAKQCGYVDLVTCETENFPCSATNKSAYTFALQGALELAAGLTSTSFQGGTLWYAGSEVMDDYFGTIARWRNVYEILAEGSVDFIQDGINYAHGPQYLDAPKFDSAFDNHWWRIALNNVDSFYCNGLPMFVSKQRALKGPGVSFLTEYSAVGMDEKTLAGLLQRGLLLSGNAFISLVKQGFLGFTKVKASSENIFYHYFLTKDPLNGVFAGTESKTTFIEKPCVGFDVSDAENIRVLAVYDKPVANYETAAWVMEGEWGRLAVIGSPGEYTRCLNPAELERFRNIFDWLNGKPLSVRLTGYETFNVMPKIDADGKFRMVSLLNTGIAPRENIKINIRDSFSKKLMWYRPGQEPVEIASNWVGNDAEVIIPFLEAWGFGVLKAE